MGDGRPSGPVTERIACELSITGTVQGVGFRPFVYRLAHELELDGEVGNDATSVFVVVAGPADRLDEFARRIRTDAPPLAGIETVTRRELSLPEGLDGFRIAPSRTATGERTLIPPDAAVCDDCVAELFDPTDRRFRHPFITCTNCGPRFTIIEDLPYDRPMTTMRGFPMCSACRAEYTDPLDRRYHAQPIACHECGPTLVADRPGDPIDVGVVAIRAGEVVAIKGLGGFQLFCDARSDEAVLALRERKHRPDKPFAVMVADVAAARHLVHSSAAEEALLASAARPIVLCRARPHSGLSPFVAPDNPLLGVMLPSTPIHHLLLAGLDGPVVCTSANLGGEPIAHRDDEVGRVVTPLSDVVLTHDRPIAVPCDDSVVRVTDGHLLPIRRARGYAPVPVAFDDALRPVLAVGGELKNTACVSSREHAWVSQHLGDMGSLTTNTAFAEVVDGFTWMYGVEPAAIAIDTHPGYATSRWARRTHPASRIVEVQHHHAHVAALMAEHHLDPRFPVVGIAFDGTGYGTDGTIWGGEVLLATADGFERIAHLSPVRLPGGDAAVTNPYRVALAHLAAAGVHWHDDLAPVRTAGDAGVVRLLRQQLASGTACVPTSSMGRLFDAVAALLDCRQRISYEAQAAIELEHLVTDRVDRGYRFESADTPAGVVFDAAPVVRAIVDDIRSGAPRTEIAAGFHVAIVELVADLAVRFAHRSSTIGLTGGVFQNALLTQWCLDRLDDTGLTVLTHQVVPPNDGGLSLGQAFVAAHRAATVEEV